MRVVLQRVNRAQVSRVDVAPHQVAMIEHGLVLLTGFQAADTEATLQWMAEKCVGLRVFMDEAGVKNCSVREVGGAVLVVPNFTLYGDIRRGRRPSPWRCVVPRHLRGRIRAGPADHHRVEGTARAATGRRDPFFTIWLRIRQEPSLRRPA